MLALIRLTNVAAGALLLLTSAAAAVQKPGQDLVLRNPSNSVHVRIHPCGKTRCGTVVWANDKAKAELGTWWDPQPRRD